MNVMIFYGYASVGDNSMIINSVKVMRSLSIQKDNLKCKKLDPNHLKWQPQASSNSLPNSNTINNFMVYHQNIRDLLNKTEELISFLSPDFPQLLCLTIISNTQINLTYRYQYKLGAKFCRKSFKNGGVSIFSWYLSVYKN
jgi:hypothetical protein